MISDNDTEGQSVEDTFMAISGIPKFSDSMKVFLESAQPRVRDSFLALLQSVNEPYTLDFKTKTLLRVVVCMVLDHENGVRSWGRAALKKGWSREQIVEAMFAVTPQVGFIPVIRMLQYVPGEQKE